MYAVIFIPDFALYAALRHLPQLHAAPVGLIPEKTARARLLQCTAAARQAGAAPGMTPSQAQARCAELQVLIRSPEAERCAQAAVLDCASAFSAYVEETGAGVCALELTHTRDLQPAQLAETVIARLARLHLPARVGFAPNADLALLAAQSAERWRAVRGAGELGGLPLESLAFPTPMREILQRWGIWSLGAFAALGQEALVERLGPAVLPLLAQAQGRVERPLRCCRQAEKYEEAVEFEHEYETLEPLLFVIRRLLEQITLRLETTYLVAAHLTLRLGFAHGGGEHERIFKIPAPTARAEVLFRALETYLEKFTAQQPINRLQLIATPCRPARQQFSLFENALRDPNQFFETLARLIALLGQDRVGVPALGDTHKPDAFTVQEVDLEPPVPRAQRRPREAAALPESPAGASRRSGQKARSSQEKISGAAPSGAQAALNAARSPSAAGTPITAEPPPDAELPPDAKPPTNAGSPPDAEIPTNAGEKRSVASRFSGDTSIHPSSPAGDPRLPAPRLLPHPGSDGALPSNVASTIPALAVISAEPSPAIGTTPAAGSLPNAGGKLAAASSRSAVVPAPSAPALPASVFPPSSPPPLGLCLRRFRPPLVAEVELGHERQPIFLVTAALRGRALEALGPMNISGEWWDDRPWHRHEWDVELADGTLCRVYQEDKAWFLEGVYD